MASETAVYIWRYFYDKIGNEFGVAGLMGNLKAESGLIPNNLQNRFEAQLGSDEEYTAAVDSGDYSESQFVNDDAGYGLAQWTHYSRKQALYNMYKSGGYSSIGGVDLACDYLWYELENDFPKVLTVLKTATSILEASNIVLHKFENPAPEHQEPEDEIYRASLGQDYYDELQGTGGLLPKKKEMSKLLLFAVASDLI